MIIGHQTNVKILQELLSKQQGGLSLLFWGPEQTGKKTIALGLMKGFLCDAAAWNGCGKCASCVSLFRSALHPDFMFVDAALRAAMKESGQGDAYDMKGARAIISFLDTKPIAARFRVAFIDDAHMLTPEAQNALLKTLEEPASRAIIILVTHNPGLLLETVRSRMMQLYFGLVDKKEIERWLASFSRDATLVAKAVRYSFLRPGRALNFIEHPDTVRAFENQVKMLLAFEQKRGADFGHKLAAAHAFLAQYADSGVSLFSLWQAIVRDELLAGAGLAEYASLLTKPAPQANSSDRFRLLRAILDMETVAETNPSAMKSAFEYAVSKIR